MTKKHLNSTKLLIYMVLTFSYTLQLAAPFLERQYMKYCSLQYFLVFGFFWFVSYFCSFKWLMKKSYQTTQMNAMLKLYRRKNKNRLFRCFNRVLPNETKHKNKDFMINVSIGWCFIC